MVETQADHDNNSDQFRCIEIKDTDQGILLCKNVKKYVTNRYSSKSPQFF